VGPESQNQQNDRVGDKIPQSGGEDHGYKDLDEPEEKAGQTSPKN
jgi:hypothetical protein